MIHGIGLISGLYVNANTGQSWVIDYRLYNPNGDAQSKLDHVQEMLQRAGLSKRLPFRVVLMDVRYAAQKLMASIEGFGKIYDCPLKVNRLVDDSGGEKPYKRVSSRELFYGRRHTVWGLSWALL